MRLSLTPILAIIALVLALLAILNVVASGTALGLAVICLALALLIPGLSGLRSGRL
jgi:hypothetical protein